MTKAPLFDNKLIGWLIRAVGSVPVYRQQDDATKLAQNLDSFRDVHAVLAEGHAVGIFPEGISHSEPQMAPLKTGAARIAIGAGQRIGHDFPIIAMGLVFRDRDSFRSEAHVIITEPFRWEDQLKAGVSDREAVRELTQRIERAMRSVTLNLAHWEDEPVVRAAEAVWSAEFGAEEDEAARIARLGIATEALQALRSGGDPVWREVAAELKTLARDLRQLDLSPATLNDDTGFGEAIGWSLSRIPLLVALPISLSGALLFWFPQWVTARTAAHLARAEGPDALVTYRILVGGVAFLAWFLIVAMAVGVVAGPAWGALAFLVQPFWAFGALAVGERRAQAWEAVRRFVLRRTERPRLDALRERQRRLADRLRLLFEQVGTAAT